MRVKKSVLKYGMEFLDRSLTVSLRADNGLRMRGTAAQDWCTGVTVACGFKVRRTEPLCLIGTLLYELVKKL